MRRNYFGVPQEEYCCPHCNDQFDDSGICSCGRGPVNEQTKTKKAKKDKKPYILESRYTEEAWKIHEERHYGCAFFLRRNNDWRVEGRYKTERDLDNAYDNAMKKKEIQKDIHPWLFDYEYRKVLPI